MDASSSSGRPVLARILRTLAAAPESTAILCGGTTCSNGALLEKTRQLARRLRSKGVGPGQCVGVALRRSAEAVAALLACWCCGAIYLPLDLRLPRQRLLRMVVQTEPVLLLTEPTLQDPVGHLPVPWLAVLPAEAGFSTSSPDPAWQDEPAPAAEAPAYLMFTSGSSGEPKGVLLSHGNLACFFEAALPLLVLAPGWTTLGCAACSFDICLFEWLAPLLTGGALVLATDAEQQAPGALQDLIDRHRVAVVQATPSQWQLLLQDWNPAQPLQRALSIGEPLPKGLAGRLCAVSEAAWNLYGPTECTIWASAQPLGPAQLHATAPSVVALGRALPGYGLSAGGPAGEASELLISGPAVALGYWRHAEASAARFSKAAGTAARCYQSGDLCRQDAEGSWHFLGRQDNQIKWQGHRIELDEISQQLLRHDSIAQAACLLRPLAGNPPAQQLLAAIVCRRGALNKNAQSFNHWLAQELPAWMLPQRYLVLDRLPLTANGKLDRSALLALAAEQPRPEVAGDSLVSHLTALFCEILDLPAVAATDSFFDLGGSSMLSATLVLAINQRFGCRLTLRQVLQTPPTVLSLARLLEESGLSASLPARR